MLTKYILAVFTMVAVLTDTAFTQTVTQQKEYTFDQNDTAVVFIDPQNEVLSEKGGAWGAVGDSVKENQTVENMGFASSRMLGTLFDGIARHTQEGLDFVERAQGVGFREAVRERDDPFGDYGSRPKR